MSENEKQEGQKTVVAFIAGLLIGGLLVWVFSSSPEETPEEIMLDTDTEQDADADSDTENETEDDDTTPSNDRDTTTSPVTSSEPEVTRSTPVTTGDGELSVGDQGAGDMVVLEDVVYPNNAGWIAVRDYEGGAAGNVLGAARFNLEEGLMPESVKLLRPTEAGSEYQVVFYTEDGDETFDLENDLLIENVSAVFEAE